MKKCLLFFILILITYDDQAIAEIGSATVTLPFPELKNLLEGPDKNVEPKGEKKSLPPVDVIVQTATYTVDCTDLEQTTLEAKFEIINLSDEWQSVVIADATESIRIISPSEAKLALRNESIHLLINPNTTTELTVGLHPQEYLIPQKARTIARFKAIHATQNQLIFKHNESPDHIRVSGAVGSNATKTKFNLPASGGIIEINLYKPDAIKPTIWKAKGSYLIQELNDVLEIQAQIRLTATDSGQTNKVILRLDDSAQFTAINNLSSGSLLKKAISMSKEGPSAQLEWANESSMNRIVMVKYSVPISIIEDKLLIPLIELFNCKEVRTSLYLSEMHGVETLPINSEWLPVNRVPSWILHDSHSKRLNLVSLENTSQLELSVKKLPTIKTPSATIKYAYFMSELVQDGGMIHSAHLEINHVVESEYKFSLPNDSKLLSCTLNGRAQEPLIGENGEISIYLPENEGVDTQSHIRFTYTNNSSIWNPIEGNLNISLPITPIFLYDLVWDVRIPEQFEVSALEGNIMLGTGNPKANTIQIRKQFFENEAPFASIYYTKRDINK